MQYSHWAFKINFESLARELANYRITKDPGVKEAIEVRKANAKDQVVDMVKTQKAHWAAIKKDAVKCNLKGILSSADNFYNAHHEARNMLEAGQELENLGHIDLEPLRAYNRGILNRKWEVGAILEKCGRY